jgi:hypothetical protein
MVPSEILPETCRVEIPIIKLQLSASVGFIHKEFHLNVSKILPSPFFLVGEEVVILIE